MSLTAKVVRSARQPRSRSAPAGLTLIELLVTLLLTAILSVMGFRVLERFVVSQEGLVQQAAQQRSLALTWAQIANDVHALTHLSPKQRSDLVATSEGGFRVGLAQWQLSSDGRLTRQTAGQEVPVVFMSQVNQIRLAFWISGEARDFSPGSSLEFQRFAQQDLGLVFELSRDGEPYSVRKIFFLPASP